MSKANTKGHAAGRQLSRREFVRISTLSGAALPGISTILAAPTPPASGDIRSGWVDHIPVCWVEPKKLRAGTNAVIWLPYLGGRKEDAVPQLRDLAAAGFLALSLDPWQHGERGRESDEAILKRVFGNFRRHMWPILGQTTLDVSRIVDWLPSKFLTSNSLHIGGMSMGGDIAVAAAGIDERIRAVAAIVATPDWLRPGMHDLERPAELLPPGTPDGYARYFYEAFDPLTHLQCYRRGQVITFECAAKDTHVPPDGALRFKAALGRLTEAADIRVNLHPELGHRDLRNPAFWKACLEWFTEH